MQWIRTGMQLGQAVKNVQRLRQILAIFAKHGFADIVYKMKLGRFLPARWAAFAEQEVEKSIPVRMREAFEELGPTFVKLGQLLSTRPDVIPESFIDEFTKLQDKVQALPFEPLKQVFEKEIGKKVEEAFSFINPQPLAAASIGQVHEAVLHSGEKVVVKIQRPEIERIIDTDISLLAFLAGLLEKYVPESRPFNPSILVQEFFTMLSYELDFVVEANNIARIAQNMASLPEIVIPKVYKPLSSTRILTLERLEGIRVNNLKAIDEAGIDRKAVVSAGARAFFKMIVIDGVFHGDLHGGNLFILPGNRIGIVDFGIVGRLSERARNQLVNMMISLTTEDYENLCYIYAEMSVSNQAVDLEGFQREIRNTISPYVGLSLKEVNVGRILIESTKLGIKYNIQVPGEWMMVFKALLTIEGMGRTLDPEFDLMAEGQELIRDLMKNQYSSERIKREALWLAKDVGALLQVLPRQLRWMMRKFSSNQFAIEIKSPELEAIRDQSEANARRMSLTMLTAGLLIAGAISLQSTSGRMIGDYPLAAVVLFGAAFTGILRLFIMRG